MPKIHSKLMCLEEEVNLSNFLFHKNVKECECDKRYFDDLELDLLNLSFTSNDCKSNHHRRENDSGDEYKSEQACNACKLHHRRRPASCSIVDHAKAERPIRDVGYRNTTGNSVLLLYSNNNYVAATRRYRHHSATERIQEEFLRRPRYRIKKKPQVINVYHHEANAMANKTLSRDQRVHQQSEGKTFPFKITPSGNFKVNSKQVVFESDKLSVIVADPQHTKVNIRSDSSEAASKAPPPLPQSQSNNMDYTKNKAISKIMSEAGLSSLGSIIPGDMPERNTQELPEYETKDTSEILDPELNLGRLGYRADETINWDRVALPEKKNLYLELYARITNYTNADCKVFIDNEEFNCHLIVLQCYSELFDEYAAVKKVELASDKCSPESFAFIYEWMITGEPSYRDLTRDNVLDIFTSAKYLKIKDLVEQCWAFIDNNDVFNEDTAFLLYMDAKEKILPEVRELMLPRIQHFFLMLVSSQDWLELEVEDVKNILKSNYIRVNCEMEIFMSAVRWLKYDWTSREKYSFEILSCVRFGNIAPWQLVDIKRNPDNPDFMELGKDPTICKMIDDGLAFVIIKYWYGQENEDFQHWNNMLGLEEPPPRNWSGTEKAYFTYREFLIYLDQYRRNQMFEKSKPKTEKTLRVDTKSSPPLMERMPPKIPTMDEFLTKKKTPHTVYHMQHQTQINFTDFPSDGSIKSNLSTREARAACRIQAAFRGYRERQLLKERDPRKYRLLVQICKRIRRQFRSSGRKRALGMFTPSKNKIAQRNMNVISVSMLGPESEYLSENSLFFPDRESVLIFGGIDPHDTYGVGKNTGKFIYRFLPEPNAWQYVGDLPQPRHNHSVAFLKGRVYLAGGSNPSDTASKDKIPVVDTVWSFDPVKRCWFREVCMNVARQNFGLVVTNQCLYSIGGQDRQGRTLASVERFSPVSGKWEQKASLNYARMGLACAKYRDYIWVAGGLSGSRRRPLSDVVESYNVRTDQWTEITKLPFPRCLSQMFVMSDKMYLIGGAGRREPDEKQASSIHNIDMWDTRTAEWKNLTEMEIARHGHSIAYLGTQILILGGMTTVYMRALSSIECYCCQRSTWVRGIACLPSPLAGHAAVTLPPAMLMSNKNFHSSASLLSGKQQ